MDIHAESKYPLNMGFGIPDAEKMIAIPIPASALDHQLTFTGTPLGKAYAELVYFLLQMGYDRFTRKRKPKEKKKKDGAGSVDVALNVPGAPRRAEEATEETEDDDDEEDDESELEEEDDAADHARAMALPTGETHPANAHPSTAELEAMDAGDEAYEILMTHEGRKCRKMRMFIETVVQGKGVIVGYVLWFAFYEVNLFNRMFLSMLGYNQAFCAKNAPALQKMRSKPNDYDIATRKSIEINSVNSFKECIRRITAGKVALPDAQLTNLELVRNDCPYNICNVFCYANIERFFAGSWNFGSATSAQLNLPSSPRYPWLIMEVPDSLMEHPDEFAEVPIDTLLREEVLSILRPTSGVISSEQRDEINAFVASMPNILQQRINERINELLEKRDYLYRTNNQVKDMREHGASDADIEQYFRDRFTSLHHELFRNPSTGQINCSEVEYVALRDAPSVTLPRATDPPLFPHRSSLPLRGDVLRQFVETLVKHCFMHKGDRLNQAMSVFLSSLPCDTAYTFDEIVLGLFGEKETGKSTALILREHLTCDKRVIRNDSITAKSLEINENWNNHIIMFEEVNETVLGIQTGVSKNNPTSGNSLVNAQKQIFTGGYHHGTFYMSDANDRTNRSRGEYMLTGSAPWLYAQNMKESVVRMSPLISRFCLFHNQYVSKAFIDPDSASNNDAGLTRDMEKCVGPYGQRFFKFMKKIDMIMLIYCIYVKMGCFAEMDMTFARVVMNAMNDELSAKRMRKYGNRLGDRLRTIIRRTDIWLSILSFFASGLSVILLPGKTHLDFETLVVLDRYIQANACSTQAMAYVLTLFSTEIIVDTNHIVQDAIKTMYEQEPHKFVPSPEDETYLKPTAWHSKAEMVKWLTDTTGINAMDAPNALYALAQYLPMDDSGTKLYRPLRYGETSMSVYLIHHHFLEGKGPNMKDNFTTILHQCMCVERSTPQVVMTSFNHRHVLSAKSVVTIGAIHHCLMLAPVRGRYLILRKHNENEEDVDHPTLLEYITNDWIVPRDPALWNKTPLEEDKVQELPQYPYQFANEYYVKFLERKREAAFLKEANACIPSYCVTADVMLLDEVNAAAELQQRITHLFPAASLPSMIDLFVAQTQWYRLLHRQWKMSFHYRQWLEYAVRRPQPNEDFGPEVRQLELEIEDGVASGDLKVDTAKDLYEKVKEYRGAARMQPGFESVFGTLAETLADAIPLPPWYYLLQCEIQFRFYRPKFISASFIETLRHMGTTQEKGDLIQMENNVIPILRRNEKKEFASYHALPTTEAILRYDPENSTMDHLLKESTIVFWSRQRGGVVANLLRDFQRCRKTWCRLRHLYGILLEYKMVALLYALTENALYATVAFDRVSILQEALKNEPMPADLPDFVSPLPLSTASSLALLESPVVTEEMEGCPAMKVVFQQMQTMHERCRTTFGITVFDALVKTDCGEVLSRTKTMKEVLMDELRTTIFASYGTLYDAHFKKHADLTDAKVHELLMADPLLKSTQAKLMEIEPESMRSNAMRSRSGDASKRTYAEAIQATSEAALCKRRMIAFQKK